MTLGSLILIGSVEAKCRRTYWPRDNKAAYESCTAKEAASALAQNGNLPSDKKCPTQVSDSYATAGGRTITIVSNLFHSLVDENSKVLHCKYMDKEGETEQVYTIPANHICSTVGGSVLCREEKKFELNCPAALSTVAVAVDGFGPQTDGEAVVKRDIVAANIWEDKFLFCFSAAVNGKAERVAKAYRPLPFSDRGCALNAKGVKCLEKQLKAYVSSGN